MPEDLQPALRLRSRANFAAPKVTKNAIYPFFLPSTPPIRQPSDNSQDQPRPAIPGAADPSQCRANPPAGITPHAPLRRSNNKMDQLKGLDMQSLRHASAVEIAKELDQIKRKWNRIAQIFQENAERWQQIAPQHFPGILALSPCKPGETRISASTLGKDFVIELSPTIRNEELYGKVTARVVEHPGKRSVLACELLISTEGLILSPDGERLIDMYESDSPGYRLLAELLYKVIAV